jgi:antitoxin MazE
MGITIRSKVINIGNSRGIRVPRPLLEQAGLTDEVEMSVEGNKLIIHAARQPRQGWDAEFSAMEEMRDDQLLDDVTASQWDEEEWEW